MRDSTAQGNQLISQVEGRDLARRINAVKFLECSAKENIEVRAVVEEALQTIIDDQKTTKGKKCPCCCLL